MCRGGVADGTFTILVPRFVPCALGHEHRRELILGVAAEFFRRKPLAHAAKRLLCALPRKLRPRARRPRHREVEAAAEVLQHPAVDLGMAACEEVLHVLGIRQEQVEVSAARVEECTAADAARAEDLVHDVLKQDLKVERAAAQALECALGRDRVDERLYPRDVRRYEEECGQCFAAPLLVRVCTVDVLCRRIAMERSRVRRCHACVVIERDVRARRGRHIAHRLLKDAQEFAERHVHGGFACKVSREPIADLPMTAHCVIEVADGTRKEHPRPIGQTADRKALLRPIGSTEAIEHALKVCGLMRRDMFRCGCSRTGKPLRRIEDPSNRVVGCACVGTQQLQKRRILRAVFCEEYRPRIVCSRMRTRRENADGAQECRPFDPFTQIFHSLISFRFPLISN